MATKKTYSINDLNSTKKAIRFTVGSKSRVITFESKQRSGLLNYVTIIPKEQKAIEESKQFLDGVIQLTKTENTNEEPVEEVIDEVAENKNATVELQKLLNEKESELQKKESVNQQLLERIAELELQQKNGETIPSSGIKTYPDVKTFAEAKEILRGEPWKVGANNNSLKTAEGVLAKAVELGISFPNLQVE